MKTTKLLVQSGYSNGDKYAEIIHISPDMLPLNVGQGFRCSKLCEIPSIGETVYLGDSARHYFPSDVMVTNDPNIIKVVDKYDDGQYEGYEIIRKEQINMRTVKKNVKQILHKIRK